MHDPDVLNGGSVSFIPGQPRPPPFLSISKREDCLVFCDVGHCASCLSSDMTKILAVFALASARNPGKSSPYVCYERMPRRSPRVDSRDERENSVLRLHQSILQIAPN